MATAEDLRLYQRHQTRTGMQPASINSSVSALRFFFTVTLDRPDLSRRLTVVPQPRRIPAVLSVEEVTLLLWGSRDPRCSRAAVRRPKLEVADVFHRHGADWRRANAGHVSLGQLQVMSAIEQCRSAALGGHVERCEDCGHSRIAYNSCRNRHCPKCHGAAAEDWLAARQPHLLPVGYFHVVFTLPAQIAPIAYQNKAVVYDLLFRTAAETLLTIAAH